MIIIRLNEYDTSQKEADMRNDELVRCYNEKLNDMGGLGPEEMKGFSTIQIRCTSHYINVSVKKLYPVSFYFFCILQLFLHFNRVKV